MSLNGLENSSIVQAYQSALQDAAGWFLLQYTSRDEVALLGAGNRGIDEAREALAEYKDKSPLFGFVNHDNNRTLLKYIPHGTSRLLQARVAVHTHDVADRFSHDTVYTVETSNDLTGAALSAACSVEGDTAHSRSSTSSSEKTPRLHEIAETADGASTVDLAAGGSTEDVNKPATLAPSDTHLGEAQKSVAYGPLMDRPRPLPRANSLSSRFSADQRLGSRGSLRGTSHEHAKPDVSRRTTEVLPSLSEYGRQSSVTFHPSLSDMDPYDPAFHYLRPKVKLGPRPASSKRPRTGGSTVSKDQRGPVASLPPGMRPSHREPLPSSTSSPMSRLSDASDLATKTVANPAPPAPPAPPVALGLPVPEIAVTVPFRPPSRAESTISFARSTRAASVRSQRMTPERQRLMKALQLRKNQLSAIPTVPEAPTSTDVEETKPLPTDIKKPALTGQPSDTPAEETVLDVKADSGVQVNANLQSIEDDPPAMASPASLTSVLEDSELASTAPSSLSDLKDIEQASSRAESPSILTPVTSAVDKVIRSTEPSMPLVPAMSSSKNSALSMSDDIATGLRESEAEVAVHTHKSTARRRRLTPRSTHTRKLSAERRKRHAIVEPLQIDFSEDNASEDMSDDSLMEELRSAEVKEAKPVYTTSVSKSPTNLLFPKPPGLERRSSSHSVMSVIIRRSSTYSSVGEKHSDNGVVRPDSMPVGKPRPVSMTSLKAVSEHRRPVTPGNINVTNGISERIKTLAEVSARDTRPTFHSPVHAFGAHESSQASFLALPNYSFGTPPRRATSSAHSTHLRPAGAIAKGSSPISGLHTLKHDPKRYSPSNFRTVYNVHEKDGKTESISVTARIIRTASAEHSDIGGQYEAAPARLRQRPLVTGHDGGERLTGSPHWEQASLEQLKPPVSPQNHSRNKPSLMSPTAGDRERSGSAERETAHSVTWERSSPTLPRPSLDVSWRHFRRRSRETRSPAPVPRALSISSMGESAGDERTEEKRESRTSRLLKRVSLLSSGSRRSLASHQVKEELVETQPSIAELQSMPPAVELGVLNVQFPDTLLWKRRWVEIDAHGYITFGQSRRDEYPKGIMKRYRLAEFYPPFAPDQERQEMPHSIVLEFLTGSSLQCACEDPAGQLHTLNTLQDYHRAWKSQEE